MKCPHCGKETDATPDKPDNKRMLKKYPFCILSGFVAYESEKAIKIENDDLEIDDFFPKSQIRMGKDFAKVDNCSDETITVWLSEWITKSKGLEQILPRFDGDDDDISKAVPDSTTEQAQAGAPEGDIPFG